LFRLLHVLTSRDIYTEVFGTSRLYYPKSGHDKPCCLV